MNASTKALFGILALSVLTLARAQPAEAQIKEATVQVKGLACPFCVKGVEKQIGKIEGVEEITTNLQRGEVHFKFAPGASFSLTRIEEAVVRGGFTPGTVQVTALGKVRRDSGELVLDVTGVQNSFVLEATQTSPESISVNIANELTDAADTRRTLKITGEVRNPEKDPPSLAVMHIEKLAAGEKSGDEGTSE